MSDTRARSPRKTAATIATSEAALDPPAGQTSTSAKTETTTISRDAIEQRAYELSQRGDAGTSEQNWLRAEQELRDSADA